jgi:hypothetical protein
MHIQTILKTVLEGKKHDYYGIVRKASEILEEDDLCKMAVLVTAIVKYRKGKLDPTIVDFAAKCLNKYPNLVYAFTRIGVSPPVNPPDSVAGSDSDNPIAGDSDKEPVD